MLCMLFVLFFIVFMYYFTCISFAIRPSGRKSAIKLIDVLLRFITYMLLFLCFVSVLFLLLLIANKVV